MRKLIILPIVLLCFSVGLAYGNIPSTQPPTDNVEKTTNTQKPSATAAPVEKNDSANNEATESEEGEVKTNHYSEEIGNINIRINDLENKIEQQVSQTSLDSLTSWDKILLISTAILLILVIVLLVKAFTGKKERREEIIDTLTESESVRLGKWEDRIIEKAVRESNRGNQSSNKSTENELIRAFNDLQKRVNQLEDNRRSPVQPVRNQEQTPDIPPIPTQQATTSLYADAIINSTFHRVTREPNPDTVFELFKKPGSNAIFFRIYPDAYKRVLKNPDFIDGCEKQIINQLSPQNLEVEDGIVSQDDSGKWNIIQKAKVKFI
jgi:predicted nucleic-acid-binding protein